MASFFLKLPPLCGDFNRSGTANVFNFTVFKAQFVIAKTI
jgi:hypothetical protein